MRKSSETCDIFLMLFVKKFKGKVPKLIINDEDDDDDDDDDELFLWYV